MKGEWVIASQKCIPKATYLLFLLGGLLLHLLLDLSLLMLEGGKELSEETRALRAVLLLRGFLSLKDCSQDPTATSKA